MKGTIVNLNVNPCKMCMPMGSVTAFYGIKKCMTILHGSQGCSTYIRRHMATHYNEPVDIASSSLTEEGTVYGGEENLMKGLNNLIKVYQPEVIGVSTTCLAETIGEDVPRIIDKFYQTYPEYQDISIIPVPTAGYAGTQFEGYMKTLYHIVKSVIMDTRKNEKVNIVTSTLSPGDTRYLKDMLELFEIDAILLPDLSENLDGIYKENYDRLPSGGTDIKDIKKMAGARYTIEISSFTKDNPSVAEYLYENYGVPYKKIPLPVSLRDIDNFINILVELSGKSMPKKLEQERGRFLDAMIDGHKYNGEARAVIYGEPDFVYSTVRLCVENGIMPMITATGSKCNGLKEMLEEEIREVADSYYIDKFEILHDVDFQTMEIKAKELGINILIGNSDGRRMAENLGVSLVRRSFPIHDRVGGQRLRTLGYEGALTFLDEIANVMLAKKETGFREELYHKYYKSEKGDIQVSQINLANGTNSIEKSTKSYEAGYVTKKEEEFTMKENNVNQPMEKTIEEKTATHPCYTCGAHDYARMHLPVAPKCNISCNYCVRKFDCPNESRPGVTTKVLSPEEAFAKYLEVKEKVPNLTVVGIAGPGDALANFENTRKTLELIREHDKNVTFCLSTNGLMLPQYARDLIDLGVSHVTVTMNTIDPKIGAKIYREVNYMGERYFGEEGATILLTNQLAGIAMLTAKGIMCKVNIVMLQGINDEHIPTVVEKVKDLGVHITNIMQMIPVKGSVFENLPLVSNQEVMKMRKKCGETMKQMYHCRQCRADAIGTLDHDRSIEFNSESACDNEGRIQIAVATKSGMVVDQHFGQVSELYVYEYKNGNAVFKERRPIKKYCSGSEECETNEDKITGIINTISDCDAVIVMRIGEAPKMKLTQKGIKVFTTYDRIEDSVKKAASEMAEISINKG